MRQFCLIFSVFAIAIWCLGCGQTKEDQHADETGSLNFRMVDQQDGEMGTNEIKVFPASHSQLATDSTEVQTAQLPIISPVTPLSVEEHLIPGTAEWDLLQIAKIQQELQDSTDKDESTLFQQHRRIVSLATHAISSSYQQAEQQQLFDSACHALMESLLVMALAGDAESVDNIYTHAHQILQEKPESTAAINASLTLVKLGHGMSRQHGSDSPWLSEYVKQTKIFATEFPGEEAQAIIQLNQAAEFCEQHQQPQMAIECLMLLKQQFPNSPFQQEITGQLNRLHTIGHKCTISGPTLTGSTVDSSQIQGRPTLVVFWSVRSDDLRNISSQLQHLHQIRGYGLICINLDEDQQQVTEYLNQTGWHGSHIFHPENATGIGNPIAQFYGVTQSPTVWLISPEGTLVSTRVNLSKID